MLTKISEDLVGLIKIQGRYWQYLIENFIARTENFNAELNITKKESRNFKEIEKKLQNL